MATPDFEWIIYEVAPAGPVGALAGAPTEHVTIPKLGAWPRALDKAGILLETAAEIEHALLVQYLYAAFSLKTEGDSAQQSAALSAWNELLMNTARDEMGHLITVQNLLLALRHAPNFEREDYPPRKEIYPFKLHLEPLTRSSLAKYVTAEAPRNADIGEIVQIATGAAGAPINRVGALYGLLGVIFSTEQAVIDGGSGNQDWDDTLRLYAAAAYEQNCDRSAWHLADDAIDASTLDFQGAPQNWLGVPIHQITNRATANAAILDIAVQGEGPSKGDEESHFDRYHNMFQGADGVPKFPPVDFTATRPVPTDPQADGFGDPRTAAWAKLADLRYGLMIGFIGSYLLTTDTAERKRLAKWAVEEMRRLAQLTERLVTLPAGQGAVAAVPFGLPAELHLPADAAERWALHRARTEASIAHVTHMRTDPTDANDAVLKKAVTDDTQRLTQMPAAAPV